MSDEKFNINESLFIFIHTNLLEYSFLPEYFKEGI